MRINRKLLLVKAMEEACEIGQAAAKCLLFGDTSARGLENNGVHNKDLLAAELGDLLGVADALDLNWVIVEQHRKNKLNRIAASGTILLRSDEDESNHE